MSEKVKLYKEIEAKIRLYRILNEINYYSNIIEKKTPKEIGENDSFWKKTKKKVNNTLNKNEYETSSKKKEELENLYNELNTDFEAKGYSINSDEEFKEKIDELFSDDKYNVAKIEFIMSIILDNKCQFSQNNESYKYLSKLFGYDDGFISNLEKNLIKNYQEISLKKGDILKNACVLSCCIAPIVLVSGIGAGIFAGALFSEVLTATLVTAGMIAGVTAITYVGLKEIDKARIKEEFSKLNVEETALNLAKTIILIDHMNKAYLENHEDEAEEIYESFIDEYIDLKSDVDLRLFINKEDIDLNDNKNKVFHNADQLLKKALCLTK